MVFSLHVGLTDSVMQWMHFFFCQCLFDIFLSPHCQIYYFNIRKKLNDVSKNNLNFRQRNSQNCQNNFITIKNFY
jgi:hypothetical protein